MKIRSSLYKALCITSIALAALCLVGYQQHNPSPFPQDLLCNGSPINPIRIVATQFGDSSRLEPKPVIYEENNDNSFYKKSNYSLSYCPQAKTASVEYDYSYSFELEEKTYEYTYFCHESYQYIGSYKNKHVVITKHYDTDGTGRFSELGLITRDGDTIKNAGEITGGDRVHGGIINAISLQDNILRFKQVVTPGNINYILPYYITSKEKKSLTWEKVKNLPNELLSTECCGALWFIYETDLDDLHLTKTFCGIEFFDDKETYKDHYLNTYQEKCFNSIAHRYIDAGKQTLDLEQAIAFVHEVWESIAAPYNSHETS